MENIEKIMDESKEIMKNALSKKQKNSWGIWKVSNKGTLTCKRDNGFTYDIHFDRLTENNWIQHMREKIWVDMNDFIPAYFEALRRRGIKELTIKIYQ